MTRLFSTTGFVLRRRAHKEADRMYTVFSRELGKVDVLARGGRKPRAKLTPHLESFSSVELFLVDGKSGYTLAGSEVEERFVFQGDVLRAGLLATSRHLVDLVTRWHQTDVFLFDQLRAWSRFCVDATWSHPVRASASAGAFALRLVRHAGYAPELNRCVVCRGGLHPDRLYWSSARGGVVCANCVRSEDSGWMKTRPLSVETLKLLRVLNDHPFEDLLKVELRGAVVEETQVLIDSLILAHFPVIPTVAVAAMPHVGQGTGFSIE